FFFFFFFFFYFLPLLLPYNTPPRFLESHPYTYISQPLTHQHTLFFFIFYSTPPFNTSRTWTLLDTAFLKKYSRDHPITSTTFLSLSS
ncbi:hypothetical protein BKA57DRAFT_454035, partial [Linnemannia elongata]